MKIGDVIKCLRQKNGMSQKDLAELLGISGKSLRAIEKNEKEPTLYLLKVLCLHLGVSLLSLIYLATPKEDIPENIHPNDWKTIGQILMPVEDLIEV
jgi:transcriptional regulator with XRE-family HTH domain